MTSCLLSLPSTNKRAAHCALPRWRHVCLPARRRRSTACGAVKHVNEEESHQHAQELREVAAAAPSNVQWFAIEIKYYINRVTLRQGYIPLKCFYVVFKEKVNRYDLGPSNEPLFIIIGQGAAKL